ncbi:MAG: hypothetical protein OEO21_01640 [Candidatus Krumholzibacteria bacterium]|nr:hypothetical protein [Candidatus Krumholzibacteria bacterium]
MKRCPILAAALLAVAATALLSSVGIAQVLPLENHYKVYVAPGPPMFMPVTLHDQFGEFTVTDFYLERLATPADKNGEGFVDSTAHQLWWRIQVPQPPRTVTVLDQFGGNVWTTGDAVYLLNPALKNVLPPYPPLPFRNHYLCYEALGPSVGMPVTLTDQFGTVQVFVFEAKLLCNPVEKTDPTGFVWPIVDPFPHLACYFIDDPRSYGIPVNAVDQFGSFNLDLLYSDCLCVPAIKEHTNPAEESTWGRIKALYGED